MCEVIATAAAGKKRLIARSDSAGTSRSTGSLTTMDRADTVVDARPRNIRVRSDAGSMSASAVRRAICARPTTNGWSPNAFDSWILSVLPPALVCTIRRSVWFRNVWALAGRAGWAAVAQVPIQCRSS